MHAAVELLRSTAVAVHVRSRKDAESWLVPFDHATISITSKDQAPASLPELSTRKDVLRLAFDCEEHFVGQCKMFAPEDARAVLDFVVKVVRAGVHALVIHCEHGKCRSRAVAAALAAISGQDVLPHFQGQTPSGRTFNLMLQASA